MIDPARSEQTPTWFPGEAPSGLRPRAPVGQIEPEAFYAANLTLRRLRFFIDLLSEGYRQALRPDPQLPVLRSERIALGIDLPELDTVPLWSARRADGTVSVPFTEYILGQIWAILDAVAADANPGSPRALETLRETRLALARAMERAGLSPGPQSSLPRLRDFFVPEAVLEEICGPAGLLQETLRQAEALLRTGTAGAGH